MDGLRELIKIDNERALDVGYLNRGAGTIKVRKPESSRRMPGGNGQGRTDELTLGAEEVGTLETLIKNDGVPLWLITTGMPLSGVV